MSTAAVDDVRAFGRRSRSGCYGCRARRKKCDETRPACRGCVERDEECVYSISGRTKPRQPQVLARKKAHGQDALEVSRPRAALFENEQHLINHFSNALTRLLGFGSDGSSNQFCTQLLPLAESSSVVLGAMETISTAHLHMLGSMQLSEAADMHSRSLRSLSAHLFSSTMSGTSAEVALTTILLMVYYEVILGNSAENALSHLKGSKAILDMMAKDLSEEPTARVKFLRKIFHYFDVMVALSLHKAPLGCPYSPEQSIEIDPIFGLTAGLWPAMHYVAQCLADEERSIVDDTTYLKLLDLANQLSEPLSMNSADQEKLDCQSGVDLEALAQISNAYRAAVLLILHHELLNTQDPGVLDRTYSQAFDALLRIAALDGPMATYSTSVWPLFTVGIYAKSSSDRTILKHMFSKIYRRHRMKIVETADKGMNAMWKTGVDASINTPAPVFFA